MVLRDKPFDGWRYAHFAATGEQGSTASDPDSDPDGDGLVNRFEFLFGSDPKKGAGTRLPVVGLRDGGGKKWLSLEYWQSGSAKTLHPEVQSSGTLQPGSWPAAPGTLETLFYDPATGDKLFRYSVDVTGLPAMFLRPALRG